jgi:predicted O-linked N-acetylglucosamine transferase (SPINDLY family)
MNPFVVPQRLSTLQIETTRRCNLACITCARTVATKAGTWADLDMPFDDFARVLANAPPADTLLFDGLGEATLHPELGRMVAHAAATRAFGEIVLASNALAVEPEAFAALKEQGIDRLVVSLASLNQLAADAVRAGTQVAKLRRQLQALVALFGASLSVVVRLARANLDELESVVRALAAFGVAAIEIRPDERLDTASLGAAAMTIAKLQAEKPNLQLAGAASLAPSGAKCRLPLATASVGADGMRAPCPATSDGAHFAQTDARGLAFGEAWNAPGVAGWFDAYLAREPDLCRTCARNPSGSFGIAVDPLAGVQKAAVDLVMAQRHDAARALLENVVGGPVRADSLHLLGMVESQQGNAERAVAFVSAAAALDAKSHIRNNLGTVLVKAGRLPEAEAVLRQLVRDDPSYPTGYISLAGVLADKGERGPAIGVLVDLAELALKAGKQHVAGQALDRILVLNELHPRLPLLGHLLRMAGAQALALRLFEWLAKTDANNLGHLLARAMTLLPVAYATSAQMHGIRAAYRAALEDLLVRVEAADDAALAIAGYHVGLAKPFYLAYQGENDVDLQRLYGRIVARMSAKRHPMWQTALVPAPLAAGRKLRVGFASGYFSRHSVSKLFAGWIRHMDRDRFEVFGYDLAESEPDEYGRGLFATFDHAKRKIDGIDNWAAAIRADALDALIYPEIGMESQAVRLAALRLAPLQMVAMGHPMTTGLATVDVFLTSDLMEPDDAQAYYTERVVRLPNLSFDYERQPAGGPDFARADLGLRNDAVVFVCCQSLFKYRPDDDDAIVRIAAQVPNAQFAFLGVPGAPLTQIFLTRLKAKFAAAGLEFESMVAIVPPVAFERFGAFLRAGDIYLDSLGWSGGNTSLEAASVGLPLVTTPGGPMRARHTAAILRFMGLGRYVCENQDAYVAFAATLAQDVHLRRTYAGEIRLHAECLFGDLAPIRAIEALIVVETAANQSAARA